MPRPPMPSKAAAASLYVCLSAALVAGVKIGPVCAGTLTTLYSFTNGEDGAYPSGGVINDSAGTLYGETYEAGDFACTATTGSPKKGCGTVYSFSKPAGLKVLATFHGPNGAYGNNTLALSGQTLYGTTYAGGASGDGVVFSINTDASGYTLLHQFSGSDGSSPTGTLRLSTGQIIYGITAGGGPHGNGVLFSLAPDGTYTILHAFLGGPDGSDPNALLIASNGTLVGSTASGGTVGAYCTTGCGTVFTYVPGPGTFTVQYAISPFSGYRPIVGSLGPGPTIYGSLQSGTFALSQKSGFKISNGEYVSATFYSGPAYLPGGSLVGTSAGGDYYGFGVLFTVTNLQEHIIYDFLGMKDGANPHAQPLVTPAGAYIGTTTQAGLCNYCGTIFEYVP